MKRIIFGLGIILFIGVCALRCDIPMTKYSVVGTYANTNYGNKPCCIESPHKPDDLTLKSDGTFSSEFFGNGTYEVNYGIFNTEIELHYEDVMGKLDVIHTSVIK